MKDKSNYDDIVIKINKQLERVKNEQAKYKSDNQKRSDDKEKYSTSSYDCISIDISDYQSLNYMSDDSTDTERYIDIRNRNNNYRKSIEKKKNQIEMLNRKMDILKKKIKMREEQRLMDNKIDEIYNEFSKKESKENSQDSKKINEKKNTKDNHNRYHSGITSITEESTIFSESGNNNKKSTQNKARDPLISTTNTKPSRKHEHHHHRHSHSHHKVSTNDLNKKNKNDIILSITTTSPSRSKNRKRDDEISNVDSELTSTYSTQRNKMKDYLSSNMNKKWTNEKDEIYWLQQKFVDLQCVIEDKDNQLNEKDKHIAELNEKLHDVEFMTGEMEWLHRKFIEYEEIIKEKDKEIEEKNKMIEGQTQNKINSNDNEGSAGDNDETGSFIEHSDVDGTECTFLNNINNSDNHINIKVDECEFNKDKKKDGAGKKLTWSEELSHPIDDDDSLHVDDDSNEEFNISESSFEDNNKDQVIKDQKQLIKKLENTIEEMYNNTTTSVMVQTDENLINYASNEQRRKSLQIIEEKPDNEKPWIFTKTRGLKKYKVEVINRGCLALFPPKNSDLIIPTFLRESESGSVSGEIYTSSSDITSKDTTNSKDSGSLKKGSSSSSSFTDKDEKKREKEKKKELKQLEKAKKKEEKEKAKKEKERLKKEKKEKKDSK